MASHNGGHSDEPTRRDVMFALGVGAGAAFFATGVAAAGQGARSRAGRTVAESMPVQDPAFNVKTLGRLQGDLSGRTVLAYSQGCAFGLVPGEGPPLGEYGRLLYRVEACTVRIVRLRADGALEERARSWMFYRDAATGRYIDEYQNPYTGATVLVPTFRGGVTGAVTTRNGPEFQASFPMESTVIGRPLALDWHMIGDQAWVSRHAFTRWKEGSTGIYKTEMTMDTWACRASDLANNRLTAVPAAHSWISQTEWQSWLGMRGRPGAMLWRMDGTNLHSLADLPDEFVEQSNNRLPGRLTEPLGWS